jgi:hypothetical protein
MLHHNGQLDRLSPVDFIFVCYINGVENICQKLNSSRIIKEACLVVIRLQVFCGSSETQL